MPRQPMQPIKVSKDMFTRLCNASDLTKLSKANGKVHRNKTVTFSVSERVIKLIKESGNSADVYMQNYLAAWRY